MERFIVYDFIDLVYRTIVDVDTLTYLVHGLVINIIVGLPFFFSHKFL
jgi:hypothetical protein